MINSYYIQSYGKKGVYFMVKIAKHISKDRVKWLRDAGLTIPEIARVLQVSPNRIQSLITKALDGMRKGNAEERLRAYEIYFPVTEYERYFPIATEPDSIVSAIEALAHDHKLKLKRLEAYQELLPDAENAGSDMSQEAYDAALSETFRRIKRREKKRAKRHRQRQKQK
jgi:hypothetical protein